MVGRLEQRKRPLAPGAWEQPQDNPDWGHLLELGHSHNVPSVVDVEREWLRREVLQWLEMERAEARQLAWKLLRACRTKTEFTTLEEVLRIFWEHRQQEQAMTRLEDAARAGDRHTFLEVLKEVERRDWSPENFAHAAQLALEASAHLAARQISEEGVSRYPDDLELQKYAHILSPPKVSPSNVPPDPSIGADDEWLKAHRTEYRGRWVALREGKLLGAAGSLRELIELVGDTRGTLLTTA